MHTHTFSQSSLSVSYGETKDWRCVSDISPVKHYVWPGRWMPTRLYPSTQVPIYPFFLPPLPSPPPHPHPTSFIFLFGDARLLPGLFVPCGEKAGTWESPGLCLWGALVSAWMGPENHFHRFFRKSRDDKTVAGSAPLQQTPALIVSH